ncbi:DEAD/DEAH box helicase [Rheinheimera gaetbuli]
MKYFTSLVEQSINRARESTLGVLGITNPNLRKYLQQQMSKECGAPDSFLADPVLEHTFGWEQAKEHTLNSLIDTGLLSSPLVNSLDQQKVKSVDGKEIKNRYRFASHFSPYTHQLISWQTLLAEQPKSVIVTSGTGSGKTECFMVPVLEDLYREYTQSNAKLVGVRAIFLYPLNALISSQRERLNAWTQAFDTNIRYCLYNGNTPEKMRRVRDKQKERPNEILSRELMREEPAPILVTNGTMLEYMLVRNIDSTIIEASRKQKSLRWIVLDEAHSYVGSQAAELSMQLRRVVQAFGVESKDVRFVATSATIADENANQQLKTYLANLANVSEEQIVVIDGTRAVPSLPSLTSKKYSLKQLVAVDSGLEVSKERFQMLCESPIAREIRHKFVSNKQRAIKLSALRQHLKECFPSESFSTSEMLEWIDLLTGTKAEENQEAFLKVRAHFFQSMLNGLWSCIDPKCKEKVETTLEDNWPFGVVYTRQRSRCNCGAPVCEVGLCDDCNSPHLLAIEKNDKTLAQRDIFVSDEFSLLLDTDEVGNEDDGTGSKSIKTTFPVTLRALPDKAGEYKPVEIDKETASIGTASDPIHLYLFEDYENECGCCGYKGVQGRKAIRRAILGSPFYVANAVPTILEYCPDHQPDEDNKLSPAELPGRGRKLITFTDSRQGTARMAVRMQQEAERSRLRGLVFEVLQNRQLETEATNKPTISTEDIDRKTGYIEYLKSRGDHKAAEKEQQELDNLMGIGGSGLISVSWADMTDALSEKTDIKHSILAYNKYANPELFDDSLGAKSLAKMLLIREFARRPKRQNSLETQGIIKLNYTGLEQVTALPERWKSYGFSTQDWQDFLKVSLDFFIRENSCVVLEPKLLKWVGRRFYPKRLLKPDSNEDTSKRIQKWPQVTSQNQSRLGKLLIKAANFDVSDSAAIDIVNEWLRAAWSALTTRRILDNEGNLFYLNPDKITFSFSDTGFVCPQTNKLIDTVFRGLTPYLPHDLSSPNVLCEKVTIPAFWAFDISQEDFAQGLIKVRELVGQEKGIESLRERSLWTDINDRTVEKGFYYRTAEHSAQQSADRLKKYEDDFKLGNVNVLNCSTTMEMGVDIGGISAVVMNNVPPHPANYLQRAGRAGRSKESRAITYTLCKSNPHDRHAFADPLWPFVTNIPAPHISLNSERLVYRHVNSLLLSEFLQRVIGPTEKEKTALNLQWFFEPEPERKSVCERFKAWLDICLKDVELKIRGLVKGTTLESFEPYRLINNTRKQIEGLESKWIGQFNDLSEKLKKAAKDSPFEYRIEMELGRHRSEYLLKELAATTFLPGYGFPTDVVTLNNTNIVDYRRAKQNKDKQKEIREDNISLLRDMPSRNLAIAIREYAPGSQLVIDGRVFKSAGISLNWRKFGERGGEKFDLAWKCGKCGQTGLTDTIVDESDLECDACGHLISLSSRSEIKKTLQPTGFVTDFFDEPTNDISSQKYVPVQPAWLAVAGQCQTLPNPLVGRMRVGDNAKLFQHSSGEHGTGYAVCLSCGKAESMMDDGEYPKTLQPNEKHRPILSTPKSKDDNRFEEVCDGNLQKEIHLGCSSYTDAFELTLRHPVSGEFIANTEDGKTIALTLAVALRNALAEMRGISTAEIGYLVKAAVDEVSNMPTMVIQLYDTLSGGAGFASSAAKDINALLHKMYEELICHDNCDEVCSSCLLDSNTRHDANNLNRHVALKWLGEDFTFFLHLPSEYQFISNGEYCYHSIREEIAHRISKGATKVCIWLSQNPNEWDLNARQVHRYVEQIVEYYGVSLSFVLPATKLSKPVQQILKRYQELGVQLVTTSTVAENGGYLAVAVGNEKDMYGIAVQNDIPLIPGSNWLDSPSDCMVVSAKLVSAPIWTGVDTSDWYQVKASERIEIKAELNGPIKQFGNKLWDVIGTKYPIITRKIAEIGIESLDYTDRYIQSPWSIILLGEVMRSLGSLQAPSFTINSLFNPKDKTGWRLHDDWDCEDEFQKVVDIWFEQGVSLPVNLSIHKDRGAVPHRRELLLTFKDGEQYSIAFDQGVGYWSHDVSRELYRFNFTDIKEQLEQMIKVWSTGHVKNSADWPSVLYLNKL